MAQKSAAPTMKDVAAEAGVALGTVSKVVNGLPVGKVYQKRVEAAIEKLGYRVNSYAQGLKASRTNTVALLVPNVTNPYFGSLIDAINRKLNAHGCKMLLCCTEASPEMEQSLLDMATGNRVDSVIALSYSADLRVPAETHIIAIDRHIGAGIPCVASDNFAGGQLAVEKLVERGCSHLLYVGSSSALPNEPNKRRDGFLSACATRGLPYEMLSLIDPPDFSPYEAFIDAHMEGGRFAFDGVFCVTDAMALQVRQCLESRGIPVPEQVQIIGFDGVRNFGTGEYCCSSIEQPVEMLAGMSVELALRNDYGNLPPLVCLPVTYVSGGTTREDTAQQ